MFVGYGYGYGVGVDGTGWDGGMRERWMMDGSRRGARGEARSRRTDVVVEADEGAGEFWIVVLSVWRSEGVLFYEVVQRGKVTFVTLHDDPDAGADAFVDEFWRGWSVSIFEVEFNEFMGMGRYSYRYVCVLPSGRS